MADPTADDASSADDDPPTPERRSWSPRSIVGAVIVVAVFVGATVWVAGDDAFELFDSSTDTCAVEAQPSTVENAAPRGARQNLSAAPVLQWTRVDAPAQNAGRFLGIRELSNGLVLIRVDDEGRERVLTTSNGVEWDELPIPPGASPRWFAYSHGRWVIWGVGHTEDSSGEEQRDLNRVLTSTNKGRTWTDVPVPPPEMWIAREDFWLSHVVTSRNRIVLVTRDAFAAPLSDRRIRLLYAGDENGLEVVTEFDGELVYGTATADAFVLVVRSIGADRWQYLASVDGREWDEVYSIEPSDPGLGSPLAGADNDGNAWALIPQANGHLILVQLGCGHAAVPIATFEGPGAEDRWKSEIELHVGPSGFVALETLQELEVVDNALPLLISDDDTPIQPVRVETTRNVLWSRDGRAWTAHDVRDALGVHSTSTRIELAVGTDFVIASVTPWRKDSKWYMAEIP